MRIQCIVLEYKADLTILRCNLCYIFSSKIDVSRSRIIQTSKHEQCGGFSTARWSEQTNQLTICNVQVHVVNSFEVSICLRQILNFNLHSYLNLLPEQLLPTVFVPYARFLTFSSINYNISFAKNLVVSYSFRFILSKFYFTSS